MPCKEVQENYSYRMHINAVPSGKKGDFFFLYITVPCAMKSNNMYQIRRESVFPAYRVVFPIQEERGEKTGNADCLDLIIIPVSCIKKQHVRRA
jgi:hypothetical protein